MALKGTRRPHAGLISQQQQALRAQAQAASGAQAQLEKAFPGAREKAGQNRPGSSSHKPPLPGGAGYPRSPSGTSLGSSWELPEVTALAGSPVSRSSSRGGVGVSASSPSNKSRSKGRSSSVGGVTQEVNPHRTTPRRSPSAGSSTRTSGRGSPRDDQASAFDRAVAEARAAAEADADENFADTLAELDELTQLLGVHVDEPPPSAASASDGRPATGCTSASGSTTVPAGSKVGDLALSTDTEEAAQPEDAKQIDMIQQSLRGGPRLQREMQQCRLPHGCRLEASQGSAAQLFFTIDVAEGPYTPATVPFWIKVFDDFPAAGSCSIRSTKRIFHPCIDPHTGHVELNDSVGHLDLRSLLMALRQLIVTPPFAPTANPEAAMLLQADNDEFRRVVRSTLNGGEHGGVKFDRVLQPSTLGKSRESVSSSSSMGRGVSDKLTVDLMELESMKDKFKVMAKEWQEDNLAEWQHLMGDLDAT